jgi:hypothetical protein
MGIEKHYPNLLDALRATPEVFSALLYGVTQEEARAARGGDEQWSVVQVICHLRDNEQIRLERIRRMRKEDNPHIAGYDQEKLAKERNYAADNLGTAASAFLRNRYDVIAEFESLSPAEWERTGQHEEQGTITIADQLVRAVTHDNIHAAQIARQLARIRVSPRRS